MRRLQDPRSRHLADGASQIMLTLHWMRHNKDTMLQAPCWPHVTSPGLQHNLLLGSRKGRGRITDEERAAREAEKERKKQERLQLR